MQILYKRNSFETFLIKGFKYSLVHYLGVVTFQGDSQYFFYSWTKC